MSQRSMPKAVERHIIDEEDDLAMFSTPILGKGQGAEPAFVYGSYSFEEQLISIFQREQFRVGRSVYSVGADWALPSGCTIIEFLHKTFPKANKQFTSQSTAIVFGDDFVMKVSFKKSQIETEIYGEYDVLNRITALLETKLKRCESFIEWVYNADGREMNVQLNYRKGIRAAYPWIDESYETLNDYADAFLESEANILILIGPPGTGKTTLIKNLIHRSNGNAKVTYDPEILGKDRFFAEFITDDTKMLVMEDADAFLRARQDGNTMMHRFLNVSDGLISTPNKKLVFSTNLPNVSDIDEALLRPGRCFDILQFRALTRPEAQGVLDEIDSELTLNADASEFTLATIFGTPQKSTKKVVRKTGFY